MQAFATDFKRDLLHRMLAGLKAVGGVSSNDVLERKRLVKLTADVAMAGDRGEGASWSRAVVAGLLKEDRNKDSVRRILGGHDYERMVSRAPMRAWYSRKYDKFQRSRMILSRRMGASGRRAKISNSKSRNSSSTTHGVVKKKTQVLKRLVPGGRGLKGHRTVVAEALDYVVSLEAQVVAMRCLADAAAEFLNSISSSVPVGDVSKKR